MKINYRLFSYNIIGVSDNVRCFHCSLELSYWNEEHDPLVEHALYSSGCPFLIDRDRGC